MRNCQTSNGRHALVSNGNTVASGLVYYRCKMIRGDDVEAGHKRWVQGVLYDNVEETAGNATYILLGNRGDWGTQHGWAAAHSVIWNFNAADDRAEAADRAELRRVRTGQPARSDLRGAGRLVRDQGARAWPRRPCTKRSCASDWPPATARLSSGWRQGRQFDAGVGGGGVPVLACLAAGAVLWASIQPFRISFSLSERIALGCIGR